eukprot:scaffold1283_cov79-Skeletonema_dohrnii-CCMP3373.AAC.4
MWRCSQAVQTTAQRWLRRVLPSSAAQFARTHQQHHSVRLNSASACRITTAFGQPSSLLHRLSILSGSDSHPSLVRYGDVRTNNLLNPSNPSLLFTCHSFSTRRPRAPMMKDLHSVEEVIVTAYEYLDDMSRRDVSAFWTCISKLMTKRQPRQQRTPPSAVGELSFDDMEHMLYTIFDATTDGIGMCNMKALTETTLGMAKLVKILRQKRRGEDSSRSILRRLLVSKDMKPNRELFKLLAGASMDIIHQFDARHLSNLAYAYALIDYVPEFDDGSDLFDHIAMNAVDVRAEFNAQHISNMLWAFATVNKSHAVLFEAIGDQVVAFEHLGEFKHPQDFSNTLWAYAKAGVNHPKLFDKLANHVVVSDSFDRFSPQALSNTVWAYATSGVPHAKLFAEVANLVIESETLDRFDPQALSNTLWAYSAAGVHHPKLFEKMANHFVESESLHGFIPQNLANTVWAYATANVPHSKLFQKVANHIVESDKMDRFNSRDLSNIVWAFATAQVSHPKMFRKVAKAAIQRKEEFHSQAVANLLWSYATMGIIDKQLFLSFVSTAAKLIGTYNNQDIANIAWAYAVAGVDAPTLFNDRFNNKCIEEESGFEIEALRQLHQWHLWQTKEKSNPALPIELQERCYDNFISAEPTVSKFQDDVVAQLSFIGLDPKEEVLMGSGYRIDALVEVNGKTIGVEVDGPHHFIGKGRSPLARTILKRRQVPPIDGIELVTVPYWEWDKLGKDQAKKQEYLRHLLGLKIDNE